MKTCALSILFLGYAVAQCPINNIETTYAGPYPNGVWLRRVVFTNASSKTIIGIKFATAWRDAVSDIHSDLEMATSDSKVKPGTTKKLNMGNSTTAEKGWLIAPPKILYDDGTTWSLIEQWRVQNEETRASLQACFGFGYLCGPKSKPSCKNRAGLTELPAQLLH